MSASEVPRSIEKARTLIAQRRTEEARAVLSRYRGIPALAGPVEMLVGYSQLIDVDLPGALNTLRTIPMRVEPTIGLAVGRMLLTCDGASLAFERFRCLLVQKPDDRNATAGAAEAAGMGSEAAVTLALSVRADLQGARSPTLMAARLCALVDLGRHRDAAALLMTVAWSDVELDAVTATVAGRLYAKPSGVDDLVRLTSEFDPALICRPAPARIAAAAAFRAGAVDRAAAILGAVLGHDPLAAGLRREIALERGDVPAAERAIGETRAAVLGKPGEPDPLLDLLAMQLQIVEHDSTLVLRLARRAACLLGSGLRPAPDMLFTECVRLKNDMSLRVNSRGPRLAHALGALAAEATYHRRVAVRNGATHARISIAGRELSLQLTSEQIRQSVGMQFALEPGMLRWFATFSAHDVLVDVGANIGMFTVLAAGLSGCRVIAIEPFSLNVAELEHNVAFNGLQNRVTVMHAAATDSERVDTLYFGQSYAGAANQSFGRDDISEQYADRDAGRETVRGVPLDALVARGEIPFPTHVKIDVDGFEEQVIGGMRGILSDPRFKSLRMEIRWQDKERYPLVESILAQGFSVAVADDVKNLLFVRRPEP